MNWRVIQDDSLNAMQGMADSSVSLILTDPPFYKVKAEAWDRQWKTPAEYLAWLGLHCQEWRRILKPNGSLYVFASPEMASRVECEIRKYFNVLNNIRWEKEAGWHKKAEKESLRSYLEPHEQIIFAEQFDADENARVDDERGFLFEPLRAYLAGEFQRVEIRFEKANEFCGTASMAAKHYFSRSQWCLPTMEHYAALQRGVNACGKQNGGYLKREYEDLRREYEALRRPFNITADIPFTDVWTFPTVRSYDGKHSCEKPYPLIEHIIKVSSREGDTILDPFAGSFIAGDVCRNLKRDFVGIDSDPFNCEQASYRFNAVNGVHYQKLPNKSEKDYPLFSSELIEETEALNTHAV